MNEVAWIKSLEGTPGQARGFSPRDIDVTNKVLRTIRVRESDPSVPSLALPALFATIAGSTVALIAFQLVTTMQDPFTNFLDAFNLVLQ